MWRIVQLIQYQVKYDTKEVDYRDEESYERTLYRLYDWGYTRILPADKMELIKPFINPNYRFIYF